MAEVELACTVPVCDKGAEGSIWKTPKLAQEIAFRLLEKHENNSHNVRSGGDIGIERGNKARPRLEKLQRPSISMGCTQQDFRFFKEKWGRYKRSAGDADPDLIRDQLLDCPDDALQKHLSKSLEGRTNSIDEDNLMEEIKRLAVVKQSNLINTVALMNATQDRGEAVRPYVARLRGLAASCDLSTKCGSCNVDVNFVNKFLHLCLVKGLADEDTKHEILSKVDEMSLDDTITFIEARETGKKSIDVLSGSGLSSSHVHKVNSSYKSMKDNQSVRTRKCGKCGENIHNCKPGSKEFKEVCLASDFLCKRCNSRGHFPEFCKNLKKIDGKDDHNDNPRHKDKAGTNTIKVSAHRIGTSPQSTSSENKSKIPSDMKLMMRDRQNMTELAHKEFSDKLGKFVPTKPMIEPNLNISITVEIKAYENHDPPLDCFMIKDFAENYIKHPPFQLLTTADSGAQVNVLGSEFLPNIGLDVSCLLRTKVELDCADGTPASTLGVFMAKIRGKCLDTNQELTSQSMVYVIPGTTCLLSRKTLEDIGCLPRGFPKIGQFTDNSNIAMMGITKYITEEVKEDKILKNKDINVEVEENKIMKNNIRQPKGECDPESDLPCSCPRRNFMDPPEELPMPATASNRKELEDWIKNYYKTSAFNLCKRQHWPETTGPPMKIHTAPDTTPTYIRKPTKIPLHFRDQIRAGLEADVKKGIIERVPDEGVDTWCSQLVIQPKKNGAARRTVDLLRLSKAGLRESHHTRSAVEIA